MDSEQATGRGSATEADSANSGTEADSANSGTDAGLRRAELALALLPGIGPRTRRALLDRFGDAQQALAAPVAELRRCPGVGAKLAATIRNRDEIVDVDAELTTCRQRGVEVILESDEAYPAPLRTIPDPPGVLFVRGQWRPLDRLSVAIVGTRHASRYGHSQADRLAAGLVRAGLTVVSGLARGIDGDAHRAALRAGGRTVGVLGGGVLNIYPPEHGELAELVAAQGALLSEAPPLRQPLSGAFPQRNRLISGLSLGVIVVEAAERSGALITARHALEQGREVFAVPGQADSRTSRGCHQLIRDGAKLVVCLDDVLEELGPLESPIVESEGREIRSPAELQLNQHEQQVLDAVDDTPRLLDEIGESCGLPMHRVMATLCVLETRRLVERLGGGRFVRAFRP